MGMTIVNTAIYRDLSEQHALYSEQVEMPDIALKIVVYQELNPKDGGSTRLSFNVNKLGATLPPNNKQTMMDAQATNLELFKDLCENNLAQKALNNQCR